MTFQMPDKGMYIWQVANLLGGNAKDIAEALNAANIRRADIKVSQAQNIYKYWRNASQIENVTIEWLEIFRQHFSGKVMGWGFCNGYDPAGEGRIAAEQVARLGLDYYGFNVETTFERQPSAAQRASDMMVEFRKGAPDVEAMWVSWPLWKNPSTGGRWHYDEVARNGMLYCQFSQPMIYWPDSGATNAKYWLENSIKQWRELVSDKPIIPVGRLYTGDGGVCTPEGIIGFGEDVRQKYKLFGESWYRMGTGLAKVDWWKAMSDLPAFTVGPPQQVVPVPVWRNEITLWAKKMGYEGPWPAPEKVNGTTPTEG